MLGEDMALWITDNVECDMPGEAWQNKRFYFCDLILVFIEPV